MTSTRSVAVLVAFSLLLIPGSAGATKFANGHYHKAVCGKVTGHRVRCDSQVKTDAPGPDATPLATASYQNGYAPADLRSAYNIVDAALSNGGGETVAIADAYDNPSAEADLAVYRSQFGLGACTTANGCFRKVNQNGAGSPLPSGDTGWGEEISLDLDMVSAACPNCHILLVEANSASFADLAAAVDRAAAMNATQISNSYGGDELFGSGYESSYNHPGVDITASSGDSGYYGDSSTADFPAASPHVTAVGGTHLVRNSSTRGWFESVWSGAGSGCSFFFSKPSWQQDTATCPDRMVADVAAVADPNTGVAVYDSYGSSGGLNWYQFGGTSVSAPLIAAIWALDGGRSAGTSYGSYAYNHPSQFWDITGGSNGACADTYMCTGVSGYDGPTGMGTPNGVTPTTPPAAPVNVTRPAINDTTPTEGQTLSTTNGTWQNNPTSFTDSWSCSGGCTNATGNSTYVVAHGDVGKTIQVTVTAHNTGGDTPATSDPTTAVAAIPADFSISVSPTSRTIRRGQSTTYTVTITPSGGFNGSVTLSASGAPPGSTLGFSGNPATSSSVLTVTTSSSAVQGNYTLTVTGTSGTLQHTATATLSVRKR